MQVVVTRLLPCRMAVELARVARRDYAIVGWTLCQDVYWQSKHSVVMIQNVADKPQLCMLAWLSHSGNPVVLNHVNAFDDFQVRTPGNVL